MLDLPNVTTNANVIFFALPSPTVKPPEDSANDVTVTEHRTGACRSSRGGKKNALDKEITSSSVG
jgi:hypothetical protein